VHSQQTKKIVQAIVLTNSISVAAVAAVRHFVSFIATAAILAQGFLCHHCSLLHNWLMAMAWGEVPLEYCT